MTREHPSHVIDWRPYMVLSVLYAVFFIVAMLLDVLPAMRAVLEATS